ncbi:hypothetical protein N7G274_006797 [Stereocaulon virgatum]|uniref:Uncharacterized protein n=1 Tax=Stereocaulon virgatum TaxID=373712 RepID=A0ABR4A6G6_9LECA
MATTTAETEIATPNADTCKPPLSRIYKVDVPSNKNRIWTRVSRVRQLLSPSKAPSYHPAPARPSSSFVNRTQNPTESSQSICEAQDPTRDSGYASYDPSAESARPWGSVSALAFSCELGANGDFQQDVASDDRSTSTVTGARVSRADTENAENGGGVSTTCSPGTSGGPVNGRALSTTASLNVGTFGSTNGLVQVAFNGRSAEKLSQQHFVDKRLAIPDAVVQIWNEQVKKQLDEDLQYIIGGITAGTDHIFSETHLYMAGIRRGNVLLAEPTIIITCGSKACRRKIDRHLSRLKLHYLDDFGYPISVQYQPAPAYWASSSVMSSVEETQSRVPDFGFSDLHRLWIEHTWSSTACGLKMKFDFTPIRPTRQCYATLGGIVRIDNIIYGMTTAHTFLARLDKEADSSTLKDTDSVSSGYGSQTETMSVADRENPERFPYSGITFKPLWSPKLHYPYAFSFLGRMNGNNGTVVRHAPPSSDWALFKVPYSCVLPNMNALSELQSIIPETELVYGDVSILCGADAHYNGLLTQTYTSLYMGTTTIEVREVLLNVPLVVGASGAWVVRGAKVCGYVIAVTSKKLSCFMVPMERAFKDIESVFGKPVTLGYSPRKEESIVEHSQASMQPLVDSVSLKTMPMPLYTSEHPDEMRIHLDLGFTAPGPASSPHDVSTCNMVVLGPRPEEENTTILDYRSTTVDILEMSPKCRRTADLISGVMKKHKYAAVTLTSLHRTLRNLQSTWQRVAINYYDQYSTVLRAHNHPSMQELHRCLVALKEVMNTLNEEFIPFLNFAPHFDDTVGFMRIMRVLWKIRGYQDRIEAYTVATSILSQAVFRRSISSEQTREEAESQPFSSHSNTMREEDLTWEEETRLLWSHLTLMDTNPKLNRLIKAQPSQSNISRYTIVPSKISMTTADAGHPTSTSRDADVLYQPFSFEDLLFASEVYMRNKIRPDVSIRYRPIRHGRAIEA